MSLGLSLVGQFFKALVGGVVDFLTTLMRRRDLKNQGAQEQELKRRDEQSEKVKRANRAGTAIRRGGGVPADDDPFRR